MSRRRYAVVGAGQPLADVRRCDHRRVRRSRRARRDLRAEPRPRAHYAVQRAVDAGIPAPSTWHPDRLEELIRTERIDRVVITARDDLHAAAHRPRRSMPAPTSSSRSRSRSTAASAAAIEDAVERTGGEVLLTFNYRYSPRNSALRQVIQDGLIGEVTSIDFSWMLDTKHGADYFRRWHREKKNSGGLLVHKASHHFDLVNWWIRSTPRRVFASGGLRFYGAENAAARGISASRPARGTARRTRDDGFELDLRDEREPEGAVPRRRAARRLPARPRRVRRGHHDRGQPRARRRLRQRRDAQLLAQRARAVGGLPRRGQRHRSAASSSTSSSAAPCSPTRACTPVLDPSAVDAGTSVIAAPRGRAPAAAAPLGGAHRGADRRAATAATAAATRSCSPTSSSAPAKTRSPAPRTGATACSRSPSASPATARSRPACPCEVADLGIRLLARTRSR